MLAWLKTGAKQFVFGVKVRHVELPQPFYSANMRSFRFGASHFGKNGKQNLATSGKWQDFPCLIPHTTYRTNSQTAHFIIVGQCERLVQQAVSETDRVVGGVKLPRLVGPSFSVPVRSVVACNCHWSSFAGGSRRRLQSDFSPKRISKMKVHFVLLSISLSLNCSAEGEDLTLDLFL